MTTPSAEPSQPPDHLAERHHRDQRGDPDRRGSVRRGIRRRLGAGDPVGLDDSGAHILQAVLFVLGVFVMAAFIRAAQRVEPFRRRA